METYIHYENSNYSIILSFIGTNICILVVVILTMWEFITTSLVSLNIHYYEDLYCFEHLNYVYNCCTFYKISINLLTIFACSNMTTTDLENVGMYLENVIVFK